MKNKLINFISILLIIWQFYGWLEFIPIDGIDPYYSLARILYYLWFLPVAIIGMLLSTLILKKKKDNKIIWILLVVSICTVIPPIFLVVRYIFYPLAIWLR